MKFELAKRVPIVELAEKKRFIDTGYPGVGMGHNPGVQELFGIPDLHVAGVGWLKRYTKFDYLNREIISSNDPIPLEGGTAVSLKVLNSLWLVKMTVGGVEGMRYIDTGAAFSYVHNLSSEFPAAGIADECSFDGRPWTAPMRRVPCEFADHQFEILCGDANDNPEYVPPEGVIGYDFFANFTLVVDCVGGKMTFIKS